MRFLIIGLMTAALSACSVQTTEYPNWPTKHATTESGMHSLENWVENVGPCEDLKYCIVPSADAFQGSVSWFQQVDQDNPKKAAKTAARDQGLKSISVLATARVDQVSLKAIEPDENGTAYAVMLEGKLKGRDARAIMLVWYGRYGHAEDDPASSGVHAFMAPKPAFEALGGMAIPGVRWFGGGTADDEDMREDGELSPKAATKKLASFHAAWAAAQGNTDLIAQQMLFNMQMQTMQIHQQTINQMQSYNNALSACGGLDCSMSMNGDGTWTG